MRAANLEKTSQACHIYHPGLCIIISFTECRSVICVFGNRLGPAPGSRVSFEAAPGPPSPPAWKPGSGAQRAGSPGPSQVATGSWGLRCRPPPPHTCAHSRRACKARTRTLPRAHVRSPPAGEVCPASEPAGASPRSAPQPLPAWAAEPGAPPRPPGSGAGACPSYPWAGRSPPPAAAAPGPDAPGRPEWATCSAG